ncbi:unnamed protein product [Mesocestoides corti]|uniref:Protein kinase domain-containing protein n=1 Tax=Mesocestoides corti TaxID=53468 RepID=A0A0R3UGS1_MESCO|nr:unnamed protein product [Mesocestoides corti]
MPTNAVMPYAIELGENFNGNIAIAAPAFDEDKLLIYREIFYDGFAVVIAARDLTTGGAVAIKKTDFGYLGNCFTKVTYIQRRISAKLRKQTTRIKTLSHPAVMKLLDFVLEPRRIVIITEMCLFGDLFNWMLQQHTIRFRDVLVMLHGLFQAFQFLHDKGYTHGYLKPTNVLFQTISPHSLVILPDLSVKKEAAYLLSSPLATCQSCTAPEALLKLADSVDTPPELDPTKCDDDAFFGTKEMDVWSIGVIALIALTGVNFFHYKSIQELKEPLDSRLEKAFSHPILSMCNKDLVTNLKRFLTSDPRSRATAAIGAKINWIDEAKVVDDDRNLLFMMEYDLLNTCKYFRSYGLTVLNELLDSVREP